MLFLAARGPANARQTIWCDWELVDEDAIFLDQTYIRMKAENMRLRLVVKVFGRQKSLKNQGFSAFTDLEAVNLLMRNED